MKVYLQTMGCDKNRVDSEIALAHLIKAGHSVTNDPSQAECIVVNTCCFIQDATQESIDEILQLAQYKETGILERLVVMGCMVNRYRQELMEGIPEIDLLLGTSDLQVLSEHFPAVEGTGAVDRILTTPKHYAFLRIADGCDNYCTYCIIPSLRGHYKSIPMEEVLEEANHLVNQGAKELILVAQDTTLYGSDLYGEVRLPQLLEELNAIEGLQWIRILYAYPERISDALIEAMATLDKVCHYIDMPIQHADDSVLKRMGRHTNQGEILAVIEKLRQAMPDITLRTTLISGFPGETEQQHDTVLDFVEAVQFDRLGVFPYSQEEGTPAARMDGQIDDDTKKARAAEIMELQQEIHFQKAEARIGTTVDVLIDHYDADEAMYVGRTPADAPDVDCTVFVKGDLQPGDFIKVRLDESMGYDHIGTIVE